MTNHLLHLSLLFISIYDDDDDDDNDDGDHDDDKDNGVYLFLSIPSIHFPFHFTGGTTLEYRIIVAAGGGGADNHIGSSGGRCGYKNGFTGGSVTFSGVSYKGGSGATDVAVGAGDEE